LRSPQIGVHLGFAKSATQISRGLVHMARIICFGDSLTSCGGEDGRFSDILQDRFPDHEVINKGAGGETFVDAHERFQADVLDLAPDVVLIEFGANDWWKDERPNSAWAGDLEELVVRIKQIGAQPVILGVFGDYRAANGDRTPKTYGIDERAMAFRKMEAEIAERHGCPYVPNIQEDIIIDRCCWRDRNHPNELGNRHVADGVAPILEDLLGCKARPIRKAGLYTTRDFWLEAVQLGGDRLAVVDGETRMTFAEANDIVERIAGNLLPATDGPAPKVAVFLPNCVEYFLVYWAVVRIGGVIVPLNTWLKEDNLVSIFENVQPQALIVRNRFDRTVLKAAESTDACAVFALDAEKSEMTPYDALTAPVDESPLPPLERDAVAIIMHTSGTTAAPKGAMMRHSDLRFNVVAAINGQQFKPSDVHLLVNPMFHCTALYSSLPTAAYQKAPVVITSDSTPDGLMRLVEKERISTFLSVPTVFQRIVGLPNLGDFDTSSLRLIAYAGSMMPVSTIRQLQAHFPEVDLHNFFGLTETISMTHVLSGEDAEERPDSIGRLLPYVFAKVVDEDMAEVPAGTVGELLFARENVIPGYFNQPEKLPESIIELDGREWFRTGDLAMVDEEGYFFIRGRKKDMIIVGGENVYSAEVEGALMSHDKVLEAAVTGIPATGVRASLGEMIKAYVVPKDPSLTETDLRRHCLQRLSSYKQPHVYQFMDALPRNPSGKVVKGDLA